MSAVQWNIVAPGGKVLASFPTRKEAEDHRRTLTAEGWSTKIERA